MGRYILATILLLAFTGTVQAATPSSERRTALVIGNSDYKLISPLRNPVNDARAMAKVLGELGFEVIAKENLDQKEMKRAIRDFGRKLGQGGVGLFYYAGHGIEVGGENFMVPLNAPIQFEDDVDVEAVSVNLLLAKLASAANRLNIVILDACRNNPYSRSFRSSASGLATMDAPTGTYIAYAAAPGRVAMDGEGSNGLYTSELLKVLPLPGLKIEDAFKRVRVAVQDKSGTEQVPWESSSLTGDFYFNLNVSVTVEAPGATTPSITESAATTQQETVFWQSVKDSADPGMFEAYLQSYPNGAFANIAKLKRDALLEAEKPETQTDPVVSRMNLDLVFWESVKNSTNPIDYKAYLQKFPDGEFAVLARSRIGAVEQTRSFALIEGNYIVEGKNPDGSTYGGNCRVIDIGDGSFSFKWTIGKQTFSGTGKFIGDTISVDWGDSDPVIYKVAADGTLNGIWADGQATETLHPKN